jgi:hypothetical protein
MFECNASLLYLFVGVKNKNLTDKTYYLYVQNVSLDTDLFVKMLHK